MLLTPHPGLIIWTIITFVLVFIVLKAAVWKPLLKALDEREQRIAGRIESAEQAQQAAQEALERHREKLAGAEDEARRIIGRAREEAEKVRQELVGRAREEAQRTVDQARRALESEKSAALAQLRGEVTELAVRAAGAILEANLDDEKNRRLADELIARIPAAGRN